MENADDDMTAAAAKEENHGRFLKVTPLAVLHSQNLYGR